MYGKPLMEISNLGADTGATVTQLKTQLEGLLEQNRQGFQRIEAATKTGDAQKQLLEELQKQFGKTEARLQQQIAQLSDKLPRGDQLQQQLQQLTEKLPRTDQLQQQLTRVEASIQAQSQRLDDSDLRKSLLRIEDWHKQLQTGVEHLAQGGSAKDAQQQLAQQFDGAIGKLAHGLDELKNGNIGALETSVRDIQRELAGVATTVANIQQGIKNAPRAAAAAAAAPAAASPAPTAAAAPSPAVAPAAGTTAGPSPAASSDGGATGYQTGTRKAPAKNVLGAIARLKQMKQ
jgi:chromosome segregation ATPase